MRVRRSNAQKPVGRASADARLMHQGAEKRSKTRRRRATRIGGSRVDALRRERVRFVAKVDVAGSSPVSRSEQWQAVGDFDLQRLLRFGPMSTQKSTHFVPKKKRGTDGVFTAGW